MVDGYIIHTPRYLGRESGVSFWRIQADIIMECAEKHGLQVFMAHVHQTTQTSVTNKFQIQLHIDGWLLTPIKVKYHDFRDSID